MANKNINWEKAWLDLEKEIKGAIHVLSSKKRREKELHVLLEVQKTMRGLKRNHCNKEETRKVPDKKGGKSTVTMQVKRRTSRKRKKKGIGDKILGLFGVET
ncbi:hypothetical protein PP175_28375 (plasmid) [Aneurinibacillus sp. Ricciae_BoGa-3]|uniref:hypothetical protein n=1 Tax=Aneurinibacillus sp. Ricciae_BoGa-3 TaxID=3022697 RepID=UPI0023414385|nr:hypothetical protein [Aneurinibacillus sp. Ricciae_BoGa-3]WCK57108.1 hypothetical protein PP175_28375 [Aneurinibacillus sp. Ricciae_BoGa-3]